MQGTISSKMSTSYWELQFTASNMNKNIWKWYLTPSKGKTNVLWSDFLECNLVKFFIPCQGLRCVCVCFFFFLSLPNGELFTLAFQKNINPRIFIVFLIKIHPLTCHSCPYHCKKYLYRYFKESKMQGTISSKMSTSYIGNCNLLQLAWTKESENSI